MIYESKNQPSKSQLSHINATLPSPSLSLSFSLPIALPLSLPLPHSQADFFSLSLSLVSCSSLIFIHITLGVWKRCLLKFLVASQRTKSYKNLGAENRIQFWLSVVIDSTRTLDSKPLPAVQTRSEA